MAKAAMDDRELLSLVNAHEKAAIGSSNGAANIATSGTTTQYGSIDVERAQALDYYHGRPLGNEVVGRSQVVSQEVRDTVEWIKPQLMRMFVGSKEMVRFDPEGPEDEAECQQATDVVDYLLMRRNPGVLILHDFFTDALLLKNGYVKVWFEEVERDRYETYTGLDESTLAYVVQQIEMSGDKADIAAKREVQGLQPTPDGSMQPVVTYDVRIRRTSKTNEYRVECIPTEDMRISPLTTHDLQDSPFVGHVVRKTRSEWKELGYDVASEPADKTARIDIQSIARSDSVDELGTDDPGSDASMEIIEGLECYMRVDYDGDGIAELRKILKAPGKIIENEPIEEVPIAHCVPIRMPHRHLGISIFDLLKDVQDIKTTLIRQTLDNAYAINNGRLVVNQDTVNLEDLSVSRAGGFIRTTGNATADVAALPTPSMVGELLPVIDYMDTMKAQRTGISATTQGLDPDTLQMTTAKAYTNAMSAATAKVELMARIMAEGVKQIALLLHGLIVRHQDKPMTVKLRNQWVQVDPSSWRRRYSCSVNVGLGTGSQDEKRGNLMMMGQVQQAAAAAGIVLPENVYNLATEMAQVLGFNVPGKFFTDPSSPQFQQMQAQKQQQGPDPKVQAAQITAQANVQRAQIQAQGDLQQIQAQQQMHTQELVLKAQIEKQRADAAFAKVQAENSAHAISTYMQAKQKHDQAVMDLLASMSTNESNERQGFIKAMAATSQKVPHGQ
jgi:hypothetical protein